MTIPDYMKKNGSLDPSSYDQKDPWDLIKFETREDSSHYFEAKHLKSL